MPNINVRVTDEILLEIQQLAKAENLTITDFLLFKSLPNYGTNILTVNMVLDRVKELEKGKVFAIPDLFTDEEWCKFSRGSRISTGRKFYEHLKHNENNFQKEVRFLKKNTANLALYKKL